MFQLVTAQSFPVLNMAITESRFIMQKLRKKWQFVG